MFSRISKEVLFNRLLFYLVPLDKQEVSFSFTKTFVIYCADKNCELNLLSDFKPKFLKFQ